MAYSLCLATLKPSCALLKELFKGKKKELLPDLPHTHLIIYNIYKNEIAPFLLIVIIVDF